MKFVFPLYAALALCLCSFAADGLKVTDLNPGKITGRLGKPLGTLITIEGVQAEFAMDANPLAVSAMDGQPLKDKINIEIRGRGKAKDVELKKGVTYRFEGYESGEFAGPPGWLNPGAQGPFQFHSFFVVTKIIEPKPE